MRSIIVAAADGSGARSAAMATERAELEPIERIDPASPLVAGPDLPRNAVQRRRGGDINGLHRGLGLLEGLDRHGGGSCVHRGDGSSHASTTRCGHPRRQDPMLHDPDRHEPLQPADVGGWDETRARKCITAIVRRTEAEGDPQRGWPMHPLDIEPGDDVPGGNPTLYAGTCGLLWALHHLQAVGAAELQRKWPVDTAALLQHTGRWLKDKAERERAAYLMGETPIRLLEHAQTGRLEAVDRLAVLIEGNMQHPARELMWGAPGTMLAALLMHERTGEARFADLFRRTAAVLWSQLEWSDAYRCHYWTQHLDGQVSTYMDAVHGFAGTALPLIRGRHLLAVE
ncbi:MAG: hypothetical protein U1F06_11105, partial [Steroidobacteraceae bacterium]